MAHRNLIASKNLDVRETSQDQETDCTKGIQRELASAPHLSSLCATAAHPDKQPEHHAPLRHTPISSLSIILSGAIVLAAPATFRLRKQPTLSRRSNLQN
jgi:hypothetical protein